MLELEKVDDEPVSLRIGGRDFEVDEETGYVTVPKDLLSTFHLSDIPDGVRIKPVEKIEGHTIHIKNDVALSRFTDRAASATVEEMFRRKFWDGETGLSPYVAALRQAVSEAEESEETGFEDDGDYIFLHYDITLTTDFEIKEATNIVDATIERIHNRADQLVTRKRDGLLKIFDRGSFENDLQHALTGKQMVALLMADIDHFKKVNDSFGHLMGDEVLRSVANAIATECDGRNRVEYRYGGEELAVILIGDDARRANEIAESLRADVEQLKIASHAELKVTISIGVADTSDALQDQRELVKRADAALYRAKQEGRNRVAR